MKNERHNYSFPWRAGVALALLFFMNWRISEKNDNNKEVDHLKNDHPVLVDGLTIRVCLDEHPNDGICGPEELEFPMPPNEDIKLVFEEEKIFISPTGYDLEGRPIWIFDEKVDAATPINLDNTGFVDGMVFGYIPPNGIEMAICALPTRHTVTTVEILGDPNGPETDTLTLIIYNIALSGRSCFEWEFATSQ